MTFLIILVSMASSTLIVSLYQFFYKNNKGLSSNLAFFASFLAIIGLVI